jgi:tetratricopeptide (TPR) repeat protein
MKTILSCKQLLLWLAFFLLLLSACAGPQTTAQRTIIDNSQPNIPSLYYYISASLKHYEGDFLTADNYYHLALEQDFRSYQIKKQILINSAYAFLSKQQDAEITVRQFDKARKEMIFDNDLLNAAYSVYSNANNEEGLAWVVSESVLYYPSTLSFLRKFYLDYSKNKKSDENLLELALKYADNNPEDIILTAKMYTLVNPKRSVALLQEAYELEPKKETDNLLSEITLQYLGKEEALKKFRTYSYPEDKDRMLYFLQMANRNRRLEVVNTLSPILLNTGDSSLIGELAFSAYLEDKTDILQEISRFLLTKDADPLTDSKVVSFLFAEALFSEKLPEPSLYLDYFNSAQDVQDVILYAMLKRSMQAKSLEKETNIIFSEEFVSAVEKRLPENVFSRYLKIASQIKSVEDEDFLQARAELCNYFLQKELGELEDWTFLLQYYQNEGREEEKIATLRKAVHKFPDNPLFLNDLGYSLLDYPQFIEEGGLLIQRAVALDPTNPYYQDSLAWFYYLTANFSKAMEHITILMQMKDAPGEISYHIGMILLANQQKEEAIKYFQSALEDDQTPIYQEKAKKALNELKNN